MWLAEGTKPLPGWQEGAGTGSGGGASGPPTGVPHTQPGCSCGHWEGGGTGTRGPKELGLTAMGGRGWWGWWWPPPWPSCCATLPVV